MKKLENLELVNVEIENNKAELTFLDETAGEIRMVNLNKNKFDESKNKWVEDDEKAEAIEKKAQKYFGLDFDELEKAIGQQHDIYAYEKFNSLNEIEMTQKFDLEEVGLIFQADITKVFEDNVGIHIQISYEGETYESQMKYSTYLEAKKTFLIDPIKKVKQHERFEDKFKVSIDNKDELIGTTITAEVKEWGFRGKSGTFIDIKKIPKRK